MSRRLLPVLSLLFCCSLLSGQESSALGSLSTDQLYQRFERASERFKSLSSRQNLTLGELASGLLALTAELEGLRADLTDLMGSFEELRNESRLLLMDLSRLESSIASLQERAGFLSKSLESFEGDLKRAQGRATGALVVSIAAGVLAAGLTVWLVARGK